MNKLVEVLLTLGFLAASLWAFEQNWQGPGWVTLIAACFCGLGLRAAA